MNMDVMSAGHYVRNYANTNVPKSTETSSFADTIAEKAETAKIDWEELAFEQAGPNAPQSVKDAWMEASKETGANGLGYTSNGIIVTEMHVQEFLKWYWGGKKAEFPDVLGSSVESAIQAAQQALYNFDHPLEPNKVMSIEERQYHMKERQFYVAFLEKLKKLRSEQSDGSMTMNTKYKSEIGEYYLQSFNRRNATAVSAEDAFSARHVTMSAHPFFARVGTAQNPGHLEDGMSRISETENKYCALCGSRIKADGTCPICIIPTFISGNRQSHNQNVSHANSSNKPIMLPRSSKL